MRSIAFTALSFIALVATEARAETKVAVVAGGPHPYFNVWSVASQDAAKDFHEVVDYRVPQSWDLNQQNQLIENLAAQGYNAFLIFPNDADGTNATLRELADN